jgi:hypothetical protein
LQQPVMLSRKAPSDDSSSERRFLSKIGLSTT